jgi:hypothetical protein
LDAQLVGKRVGKIPPLLCFMSTHLGLTPIRIGRVSPPLRDVCPLTQCAGLLRWQRGRHHQHCHRHDPHRHHALPLQAPAAEAEDGAVGGAGDRHHEKQPPPYLGRKSGG